MDHGDVRMIKKALGLFRHQVAEMLHLVKVGKLDRRSGEQVVQESLKEIEEKIRAAFRRRE